MNPDLPDSRVCVSTMFASQYHDEGCGGIFPTKFTLGARGASTDLGSPLEGVWRKFPHGENLEKKCLVKCCNLRVMTWSIMGDLRDHGFWNPIVSSHGIPIIKGWHCNTVVYSIVAL